MSEYITVVIKFDKEQAQPSFHSEMEVLGGIVDSVAFYHAIDRLQEVEEELEEFRD